MGAEAQAGLKTLVSRNPANGEAVGEFPVVTASEVLAAVRRARAAQPDWERLGVQNRARIAKRFMRLLHERKADVARRISEEAGKPYGEALATEVLVVLEAARFLAENAFRSLRDEHVPHASLTAKAKAGRMLRQPYGVVGIISPWNYPFSIPAIQVLTALVAGNAVVLKPSELTPACAEMVRSLVVQAGVPDEVFALVPGDGETGAALLEAEIDKVVFTGSVATGRRVAEAAATRLIPAVLELGGKDPMIVLDDADVEVASSGAVWGAFVNAGQACLSVERCYVHRSIYQRFVTACVEKTRRLRVGAGLDPDTDVGPMIHERQVRNVEAQVQEAVADGARVLCGGKRLPELGPNFCAPTVIVDVTHSMRLMRDETFGPVLPIMSFETEEEAVTLANDSEFGLGASVWTKNRRRGERIASLLKAGTVMVNDAVACFGIAEAPHGGVGFSGWGRTHGRQGLEEMVRLKYVDSDLAPGIRKPWWYGYGPAFAKGMESVADALFASTLAGRLRGALRSAGFLRRGRL